MHMANWFRNSILLCIALSSTACQSLGDMGGLLRTEYGGCPSNSSATEAGGCYPDPGYWWCDDAEDAACLILDTQFQITLQSVALGPFEDIATEEPWDWDGTVPGWLVSGLNALATFVPEMTNASRAVSFINRFAPALLAGYVPPDPYYRLLQGGRVIAQTRTEDDVYEAVFNLPRNVDLSTGEPLTLETFDEDWIFDQLVSSREITLDELRGTANQGTFSTPGLPYLVDSQLTSSLFR